MDSKIHRYLAMVGALLVAAACGGTASNPGATAATGTPFVIGVDYDNSGPASPSSLPAFQALEAAADQVNKNGGVGSRHQPFKIISQSDNGAATNAPAVVQSLLDQGAQVIVMASSSGSFLQVKPIIQKAQVVAYSPNNVNPTITQQPNADYTYIQAPPSTAFTGQIAQALVKLKSQKTGVIVDNAPADALNVPIVQQSFKDAGLNVVDLETIPTNASDTTAAMSRLVSKGVDAVYVITQGGAVDTAIWTGLYQVAPKMTKVTNFTCGDTSDKVTTPAALDGTICLSAVTLDNPRTKEADAVLKKALGSSYEGMNTYYSQGYEAPYTLAEAIKLGGGTDVASIKAGMEKITNLPAYWGGPKFTLTFSPSKHNGSNGDCAYNFNVYKGNTVGPSWKLYQPACTGS